MLTSFHLTPQAKAIQQPTHISGTGRHLINCISSQMYNQRCARPSGHQWYWKSTPSWESLTYSTFHFLEEETEAQKSEESSRVMAPFSGSAYWQFWLRPETRSQMSWLRLHNFGTTSGCLVEFNKYFLRNHSRGHEGEQDGDPAKNGIET